jgi:hypothetical protein
MSKNILLLAAIGGAVLLVLQKQTLAAAAAKPQQPQIYRPPNTQTVNMNGDMWTRLLGDGWRNLTNGQNADGSAAFIKNVWGNITTGDGKPVGGEDPIANYTQVAAGLPDGAYPADLLGTISPFDKYLDGGGELLGW